MAELYDRYKNVVRRGEGLILRSGAAFPAGAISEEWKKQDTVDETKLSNDDKADIAKQGYRYFKMKVEFSINENAKPPRR
ncbi:hypothetical protein M2323_001772 [Rhodoblastus acidophilus]|nr:hypothetical protein [Rhodoblastus acidophilus]MCW2332855.1 hypothetical protein [Rhodoblastus acidophilus]